jgi:polyvinyl alcohol dehydrogenase (cytochrome)
MYRHDYSGTGRAGGTLTTAQAGTLSVAFTAAIPYGSAANPIVVGGTVYVVAGGGSLMALDAKTGAVRWQQAIGSSSKGPCVSWSQGPIGAAAVVESTIYAPGGNGIVYAFDKDTGAPRWSTSVADTVADDFLWASMFAVGNKVYIGVATLVERVCGEMPGRFVALDAATGATRGTWWADRDHGHGGGVWTSPAYDPATRRIFLTTGTVADGADPTTKPWQQAFVAVDPDTMQTLDSFQPVPTDFVTDFDFGTSPVLFDLPDGRHLIAATNKNGFVYAMNRDDLAAGVLWKTEISAPGASPDLGESAISSPVYANGMVFVAGGKTNDGFPGAIAALNPANGTVLWKMHPDGFVLPAMAAVDGVLFAGVSHDSDKTGKLYAIDQRSGAVLFTAPTKGRLFAQPTWSQGMLYLLDDEGLLYAFKP